MVLVIALLFGSAFAQDQPSAAAVNPLEPRGMRSAAPLVLSITDKGSYDDNATYNAGNMIKYKQVEYVAFANGSQGLPPSMAPGIWVQIPQTVGTPTKAARGLATTDGRNPKGGITVILPSIFSSAASYKCVVTSASGAQATINNVSATRFTITGVTGDTPYLCVGN